MKVLMIKTVPKIGNAGSVINVADGFARNYLLPNALAKPATDAALKGLVSVKNKIERQKARRLVESHKISKILQQREFTIKKEANEQGTLFASLSANDVSALVSSSKYEVKPDQVIMDKHIKSLGAHKVAINLENGGKILLTINIEKK